MRKDLKDTKPTSKVECQIKINQMFLSLSFSPSNDPPPLFHFSMIREENARILSRTGCRCTLIGPTWTKEARPTLLHRLSSMPLMVISSLLAGLALPDRRVHIAHLTCRCGRPSFRVVRSSSRGATRAIVNHCRVVFYLTPVEFGFRIRHHGTLSAAEPSRCTGAAISDLGHRPMRVLVVADHRRAPRNQRTPSNTGS
jgi:hypothetical protein